MTRYFIFAGEASGDVHGSLLMQALKKSSSPSFLGVGGPLMRQQGIEGPLQMEDFQVMGFSDVMLSLPKLGRQFFEVRNFILDKEPQGVILIDYPGFNLRLAKSLRKSGFKGKIIQYICPSVWAHGKGRIQTMSQTLDLLLTVYPFESACFTHTPLKVKYIGNPLVQAISNYSYDPIWKKRVGLEENKPILALFPGSRKGEIERNMPQQLEAAAKLQRDYPELQLALSCAQNKLQPTLERTIRNSSISRFTLVPRTFSYELMRDSRLAMAKSGTVTLELALHECPTLVLYQLTSLNYYIAKYMLRLNIPHYCIVNILANKSIFPELIGKKICQNDLFLQLKNLHENEKARRTIAQECASIRQLLGESDAQELAAQAIAELFHVK
jgi:lipid-A-disaccharide synthase